MNQLGIKLMLCSVVLSPSEGMGVGCPCCHHIVLSVNQELVIDFIYAVRLFTIQVGIVFSTMGLTFCFWG